MNNLQLTDAGKSAIFSRSFNINSVRNNSRSICKFNEVVNYSKSSCICNIAVFGFSSASSFDRIEFLDSTGAVLLYCTAKHTVNKQSRIEFNFKICINFANAPLEIVDRSAAATANKNSDLISDVNHDITQLRNEDLKLTSSIDQLIQANRKLNIKLSESVNIIDQLRREFAKPILLVLSRSYVGSSKFCSVQTNRKFINKVSNNQNDFNEPYKIISCTALPAQFDGSDWHHCLIKKV